MSARSKLGETWALGRAVAKQAGALLFLNSHLHKQAMSSGRTVSPLQHGQFGAPLRLQYSSSMSSLEETRLTQSYPFFPCPDDLIAPTVASVVCLPGRIISQRIGADTPILPLAGTRPTFFRVSLSSAISAHQGSSILSSFAADV